MKLPFRSKNDWRFRWLVTETWGALHRVVAGKKSPSDKPIPPWGVGVVDARTACGLQRDFMAMPGLFSRMGLRRCSGCCARVGVPRGKGAPYNEGIDA